MQLTDTQHKEVRVSPRPYAPERFATPSTHAVPSESMPIVTMPLVTTPSTLDDLGVAGGILSGSMVSQEPNGIVTDGLLANAAAASERTAVPMDDTHIGSTGAPGMLAHQVDPVTDLVTDPTSDLVTDPVIDPVTDAVTDLVTDPVTDLVIDAVTDPVTECPDRILFVQSQIT